MSKLFYLRLAVTNIKKNAKTYVPFILTCIGTIMMYYMMDFLSVNKGLDKTGGASQLKVILFLGTIVIGIFSVIFLFYTNSFLIKRRKKEFGLFNILGMEKRHLSRIIGIENILVSIFSLIIGLSLGIAFSKLMVLFLCKLLKFNVPFGFEISLSSMRNTIVLFCIIFFLMFLNSIRQIYLANPLELLKGGNVGEKEPKTKWFMTILGAVCLSVGYYIAITTESPLAAIYLFFVAVILVIIGTYFLFIAGSIALLKLLRKNKNYYYKTKHFTSVSGMIYRMKQNAVGLSNICILSTAVLVMISTTISLYIGFEDALRNMYPRNISIQAKNIDQETSDNLSSAVNEVVKNHDIEIKNIIQYRYVDSIMNLNGSVFTSGEYSGNLYDKGNSVILISLDQYNKMQHTEMTLSESEVLFYSSNSNISSSNISFGNIDYQIKARLTELNIGTFNNSNITTVFYFILPDEAAIENVCKELFEEEKKFSSYYGFDSDAGNEQQITLYEDIEEMISGNTSFGHYDTCYVRSSELMREEFLTIYGGLFFLGIFLGLLFLMATVLIMYYKQISEGYDDKERFEIMQKVGMSREEVKKSIRSQVLTVFFLPLIAAGIHVAVAFKLITRLLALLSLTNVTLFIICTIGTILVFAVFYAVVYALTARTYYKLVK